MIEQWERQQQEQQHEGKEIKGHKKEAAVPFLRNVGSSFAALAADAGAGDGAGESVVAAAAGAGEGAGEAILESARLRGRSGGGEMGEKRARSIVARRKLHQNFQRQLPQGPRCPATPATPSHTANPSAG